MLKASILSKQFQRDDGIIFFEKAQVKDRLLAM